MIVSPPATMPLSSLFKHLPLHLINLSPFFINGKGIFPSRASLANITLLETDLPNWIVLFMVLPCVHLRHIREAFKRIHFGVEISSSLLWRYSKDSRGRSFVNMSTTCSFVPTYSTRIFFSTTYSRRKWYLIGMFFILECITGFFEILMALVLSQ